MARTPSARWAVGIMADFVEWEDGRPTRFQPGRGPGKDPEKIETIISHLPQVRRKLLDEAGKIFMKAQMNLFLRSDSSFPARNTRIRWEKPPGTLVDHLIHLEVHSGTTNGFVAAKAIEYGHTGTGRGGPFQQRRRYPGKWILHDAAGLARKEKGLRS